MLKFALNFRDQNFLFYVFNFLFYWELQSICPLLKEGTPTIHRIKFYDYIIYFMTTILNNPDNFIYSYEIYSMN